MSFFDKNEVCNAPYAIRSTYEKLEDLMVDTKGSWRSRFTEPYQVLLTDGYKITYHYDGHYETMKVLNKNNQLHSLRDTPSYVRMKDCRGEASWHNNNMLHRTTGPANTYTNKRGKLVWKREVWLNGRQQDRYWLLDKEPKVGDLLHDWNGHIVLIREIKDNVLTYYTFQGNTAKIFFMIRKESYSDLEQWLQNDLSAYVVSSVA